MIRFVFQIMKSPQPLPEYLFCKSSSKKKLPGLPRIHAIVHLAENDLGVQSLPDWYNFRPSSHKRLQSLKKALKLPLVSVLRIVYPEHTWLEWKFPVVPTNFWVSPQNQRRFLDWALAELAPAGSGADLSGWYGISTDDVIRLGGGALLGYHKWSLFLALSALFPDFEFLEWKFQLTPMSFWLKQENRRRFLLHFANSRGGNSFDVHYWAGVTTPELISAGGRPLVSLFSGNYFLMFKDSFPELTWHEWLFHDYTSGWWHADSGHTPS